MTRWKQQRLQNRAIEIGQALHQRDVNEVNINPTIDDIIDISSININNTIDNSISSNLGDNEPTFLTDAINKIKQLSCDTRPIITEKDISCALVLLKKRHRLSVHCINDIISLLRTLNVPNVPSSWYYLQKFLITTESSSIQTFICPECQEASASSTACSQCCNHFNAKAKLHSFRSFPIHKQIERILYYNKDIFPTHRSYATPLKDICDGALHQKLQTEIQEPFLTLTLNIDGI
ncbi:unnamed protein product [Rotaria sordida]|uniref:Uncharacterized protein n=1 Tax=Rotaria sordida TaxID=392033 RepID=A0A815LAM3_9BILA|nr:unnamed protein product [Rotaria sordida]